MRYALLTCSIAFPSILQLFDADKELLPVVTSYPFPSFQADSLLGIEHTFDTLLRMKNQVLLAHQCQS